MSIEKSLRRFRRRLLAESAFKAMISALALSAVGVFALSLTYHILTRQPSGFLLETVGGGLFAAGFVLFLILNWPTEKKVAARIDALGLQERVSAMVEFREETTPLAQLQRQDAVACIEKLSPKQLPLQLGKKRCMLCAISLCLAMGMLALPYDLFQRPPKPVNPEAEQQQLLRQMIAQLREDAKSDELNPKWQDSLQDIIDRLEKDLQNAQTELEQAAEIQEAIEEMQQQLKELSTREKLGKALQDYELTKALGEGISENNTQKISDALTELETKLAADTAMVKTLNDTVVSALVDSEVAETDPLYAAVAKLTYPLALLDVSADSYPQDLHQVFEDAETAILEALRQQVAAQQRIENMQRQLQDMMDRLLGNEQSGEKGSPEEEKDEKENPEGEKSGEETDESQMPPGGGGNPQSSTQAWETMTEGIYDPISGNVTYGEVFATYYAQYLKALEAGEVPQYLQEIMDRYFAALN